jgi:ribose-phosphate pyrophosphokinase
MRAILNLDPEFHPYTNAIPLDFECFTFKGGEEHIKIKPFQSHLPVIITHRVNSSSDLIRVVMATDALRRIGHKEIHLYMPYLPYARQDRVMVKGEPLSTRVFAQIINSCNFESVTVLDPHSDVSTALIDRVQIDTNHDFVTSAFHDLHLKGIDHNQIAVISPDAGAYKKIYKTCEAAQFTGSLVLCNKVRNLKTGEIINMSFDGDVTDKVCVIIDDICDGGRTFIELGNQLKSRGAKSVILIITHGIFSYGTEPLEGTIDLIYSTDSFRSFSNPLVKFINIQK